MLFKSPVRRQSIVTNFLFTLTISLSLCTVHSTHVDDWQFEEAKILDYESYTNLAEDLRRGNIITSTHILEEKYPELVPNMCGNKTCRTYMFEMTNLFIGEKKKADLQTVLLIGGFSGKEVLGTTLLTSIIQLFQKTYKYEKEMYQIANNLRVLIIPAINMQGLMSKSAAEDRIFNHNKKKVSRPFIPKLDFNMLPQGPCFHSFSSQVLSKIHSDYLIMGGMVLSAGENTLTFPDLKQWFFGSQKTLDEKAFGLVAQAIGNTINHHLGEGIAPLTIQTPTKLDTNDTTKSSPTYIHWAFGGSSHSKFLNLKCLPKNSDFTKHFVSPDSKSNRAFMFDLSLGKGKDYTKFAGKMGNLNYLIDKDHPKSKPGLIAAGVTGIRHLLEIMKPFALFKQIEHDAVKSAVELKFTSNFYIKVKGCIEVDSVDVVSPVPTDKEITHTKNKIKYSTPSNNWKLELSYKGNDYLEKNQYYDFKFNIQCDSKFDSEVSKFPAESHFVRSKIDPDFELRRNGSIFKTLMLNNIWLSNFRSDRMDKGFIIYSKDSNDQMIEYSLKQMFQIGRFFPATITYEPNTHMATFKMNEEMIPKIPKKPYYENITQDFGILNILKDSQSNGSFMNQLQLNRKTPGQSLELEILASNMRESMTNVDYEQNVSGNMIVNAIMKVYDRKIKSLNSFVNLKENEEVEMLPSIFADLLGRSAELNVYPESHEEDAPGKFSLNKLFKTVKSELDRTAPPKKISQMTGTVVIPIIELIPKVMGDGSLSKFPEVNELRTVFAHGLIRLPFNGVYCSSVNSYSSMNIKDFKLGEEFEKLSDSPNFVKNIPFYSLNITFKHQDYKNGLITLYTTNEELGDHIYVAHKRADFLLQETDKALFLRDINGEVRSFLKIYQGEFPSDELNMLGVYLMLFDKSKHNLVFDCFTSKNVEEFSIYHEFAKYSKLLRSSEILSAGKDLMRGLQNNKTFKKKMIFEETWFLVTVMSIMLVGCLIGVVVFLKKHHHEEELLNVEEVN